MLLRVHQSGHLAELSEERFALVQEGIALYKTFREKIPHLQPFWPLGMPTLSSPWLAFGLRNEHEAWLAVWRMDSEQGAMTVPLAQLATITCVYPQAEQSRCQPILQSSGACVFLNQKMTARLFHLTFTSEYTR